MRPPTNQLFIPIKTSVRSQARYVTLGSCREEFCSTVHSWLSLTFRTQLYRDRPEAIVLDDVQKMWYDMNLLDMSRRGMPWPFNIIVEIWEKSVNWYEKIRPPKIRQNLAERICYTPNDTFSKIPRSAFAYTKTAQHADTYISTQKQTKKWRRAHLQNKWNGEWSNYSHSPQSIHIRHVSANGRGEVHASLHCLLQIILQLSHFYFLYVSLAWRL